MKKGGKIFLAGIIFLSLITFASAQYYGGSISLSNILSSLDPSLVVLGVIWVVSFAIVYFAMSKTIFKEQNVIAAVIAFAVSLLITYGYNQTGWNIQTVFPNLNISLDFLSSIFPIILLVIIVILFFILKSKTFLVLGGICIVAALFNWVYEKTLLLIIGAILLIIGIAFLIRAGKKGKEETLLERLLKKRR
ncbi:MAG TPA: hypothetical protein VMC80_03310 [Patescibacteria group bacterium]|nr:hypothetical protein [Patescibacteria group bacterium]